MNQEPVKSVQPSSAVTSITNPLPMSFPSMAPPSSTASLRNQYLYSPIPLQPSTSPGVASYGTSTSVGVSHGSIRGHQEDGIPRYSTSPGVISYGMTTGVGVAPGSFRGHQGHQEGGTPRRFPPTVSMPVEIPSSRLEFKRNTPPLSTSSNKVFL